MRWRLLGITIALAIGCRGDREARLEGIRDEVCACSSAKCAEDAMTRIPQDAGKASQRSLRAARAMLDCLAKLYQAERPADDPDETDAPPAGEPPAAAPTPARP